MAVALLGTPHDPQLQRVAAELEREDAPFVVIDTGSFPESTSLTVGAEGILLEGEPWSRPTAVYVRGLACHPLMPSLDEVLDAHPRRVIAAMEEKRSLLESILLGWQTLGTRLVNSPEANAQHSRKPYQLLLLEQAGLPVPKWLASNDPIALRAFAEALGPVVYKPLAGGATVRVVEAGDLEPDRLEQLQSAPVLFQRLVSGVSIRAFVVGEEVVAAAEIQSDELDYRRGETAVRPTGLSEAERDMALRAARACGMSFTGVDLIRASSESWVLECNPSPMFAVFEDKTGLDVAGHLAQLLIRDT